MNVGVLGTGAVGRALGTGFADRGHHVKMGSRDAANQAAVEWAGASDRTTTGTFAEAAASARSRYWPRPGPVPRTPFGSPATRTWPARW